MHAHGLVFGLLDTSERVASPILAEKMRDFTLSWTRYGYHDRIIEERSVNAILDHACDAGNSYCLVQSYGNIIGERWIPEHWKVKDFHAALADWIASEDFFVAGHVLDSEGDWWGLSETCFLVDLKKYVGAGRPVFDAIADKPLTLPVLERKKEGTEGAAFERIESNGQTVTMIPTQPGWKFLLAAIENELPICEFNQYLQQNQLKLDGQASRWTDDEKRIEEDATLYSFASEDSNVNRFNDTVTLHANNARKGVFLWNLEPYDDIEEVPEGFPGPIDSLYSVGAGFKPNRILETHGFHPQTHVVYYDYSQRALHVKKYLVEHWDGTDFPSMVYELFNQFPHPDTHYHLWRDLNPNQVDQKDVEDMWQMELKRWGGGAAFREHWQNYRQLKHSFIHASIMTDQKKIIDAMSPDGTSVIWWSNAFFTVYGNWHFSIEEREKTYQQWLELLSQKNPNIYVVGSDYLNTNVNHIQAGEYDSSYKEHQTDYLNPVKHCAVEIRM